MKVLIIGTGSIGSRHIQNIHKYCKNLGYYLELDLLRSSQKELSSSIKELVNNQFYSLMEITDKYDAIFISNPTSLHYSTLISTIDYSNNFFIEKPIFDAIPPSLDKFLFSKKRIYVACPLRYKKIMVEAKKFVEENRIYSVRAISSSYLPDWRTGVDYRNTYSAQKKLGGGVLIDLIHEWDYLSYLFGLPLKISKLYGKYSHLEIDSEDLAIFIAEYKDKLLELHLDYFGRYTVRYFEVFTKDGTFCFDINNNRILKNSTEIYSCNEAKNDMYYREIGNFFSICNGTIENSSSIEHALNVLKISLG